MLFKTLGSFKILCHFFDQKTVLGFIRVKNMNIKRFSILFLF